MNSLEGIKSILEELNLKHWVSQIDGDTKELSPEVREALFSMLHKWGTYEQSERLSRRIKQRVNAAQFIKIQTIDNFDFEYNKSTREIKKPYLSLLNEIEKDNLPSAVLTGNAGLGKTHLARALGYASCQKNISVRFITTAKMVNALSSAQRDHNLERELNKYRRPQVLILDELGYLTMDNEASNLFFQVISARHDMGLGTIATTNIAFGNFNQTFANNAIAHAIVDRLASDAEAFYLEGKSYRPILKEKKKNRRKN
jgi:DNA replication protein DnaC